jgi:hypothetical protein
MNEIKLTSLDFKNAEVADFGKIFFVHSKLPDMNLIIFKNENVFQAVCIDVEIDAIGNNLKEACENLRNTLNAYIKQMTYNYNGNKKAAYEDIVKTAFSEGSLKSLLFSRYIQVKHQRIIDKISQEYRIKSRKEYFILLFKMIFPFRPIQFNLAMTGIIA